MNDTTPTTPTATPTPATQTPATPAAGTPVAGAGAAAAPTAGTRSAGAGAAAPTAAAAPTRRGLRPIPRRGVRPIPRRLRPAARGVRPARRRGGRGLVGSGQWAAWGFLAPVTVYLAVFYAYPLYKNVDLSLRDYTVLSFVRGGAPFTGLSNYRAVFADEIGRE